MGIESENKRMDRGAKVGYFYWLRLARNLIKECPAARNDLVCSLACKANS